MNKALTAKTLSTDRIILREVRPEDAEGMHEIYLDTEALLYWSNGPVGSFSETEKLVNDDIDAMKDGRGIFWTLLVNDEVVGKCTLFHWDAQNSRAEVGYLLNRVYWGQGLMIEAMNEIVRHAFEDLDLHRLEADVDPDNAASKKLLDRLGFEEEGYFRERWNTLDEWKDSIMLGLLKADWAESNS